VVLKAPDVPSVLVEMGYMSNREDAQFLGSRAGQTQIANALLAGIDSYFAALDREQF
jgi:N-acetylmuramoyl-L-alanine amidase